MVFYYVIIVFPIILLFSLALYLPCCLFFRQKHGKRPFLRHLAIFALLGTALSLLYATLLAGGLQLPPSYRLINLVPFAWVKETYSMGPRRMAEQLILNVFMGVPMGLLLPVVFPRFRRWFKTVISVAALIVVVETIQYFIGRSADIDDIIMNTLGSGLGYGLYVLFCRLFQDKPWWKTMLGNY